MNRAHTAHIPHARSRPFAARRCTALNLTSPASKPRPSMTATRFPRTSTKSVVSSRAASPCSPTNGTAAPRRCASAIPAAWRRTFAAPTSNRRRPRRWSATGRGCRPRFTRRCRSAWRPTEIWIGKRQPMSGLRLDQLDAPVERAAVVGRVLATSASVPTPAVRGACARWGTSRQRHGHRLGALARQRHVVLEAPWLSVWPTMNTEIFGWPFEELRHFGERGALSGLIVALSVSK